MCPILYVRAAVNVRILLSPLWGAREEFLSEWSATRNLSWTRGQVPVSRVTGHHGTHRAQLFGDSGHGGAWIDRVKIPAGARALAHTHPQDELVTVIEGTWYLGKGTKFDSAKLPGYPAGSFIIIPAGIPHFVAAKEGTVVVQLSGIRRFLTSPNKPSACRASDREGRRRKISSAGVPRVFALPCIRQRRKGEAPSSTNGLKRPEVSLETL
jgi:quercetin dioxygenase-like cupin family protein